MTRIDHLPDFEARHLGPDTDDATIPAPPYRLIPNAQMGQVLREWSCAPSAGVPLAELVRLDGVHSLRAGARSSIH